MTIEIETTEEVANRIVDQMLEEAQAMENVLQSFRSNELTHLDCYEDLREEQRETAEQVDELQEQIEEATKPGLEDLFST